MFELVSFSIKSLIFATILLVVFVDEHHMLLGKEILCPKIFKTITISLILKTVFEKGIFKGKNINTQRI